MIIRTYMHKTVQFTVLPFHITEFEKNDQKKENNDKRKFLTSCQISIFLARRFVNSLKLNTHKSMWKKSQPPA